MKKVLIVVGEFLGHWGRSLLIAEILRQHKSVEIIFVGRDSAGNLRNLTKQYGFRMISLGADQNKNLLVFADRLEVVMQQEQPDLIILDIGLIPWAIYVRFPDRPIAAISQYFLTSLCPETQGGAGSTYQALQAGVPVGCWPFHWNHVILSRHLEAMGVGLLIIKNEWRNQIELIGQRYQDMKDTVHELNVGDTISAVQKMASALDAIS